MKNYKHKDAQLTDFQKQVAIGSLLGDMSGSMPTSGANYHLSCYHAEKQLDWLKTKWEWLQPFSRPIQLCAYVDKRDGKTRAGGRFHTISAPCFTELATLFYRDGRKTITENAMRIMISPVALACLICDDGSWDKAGIQIASKQFTQKENELLAGSLAATYGIEITVVTQGKYSHVRIPAKSIEIIRNLCLPYVPETLHYKFGGEIYHTHLVDKIERICPICQTRFLSYESAHQIFCGRKCATQGRRTGYNTRTKIDICPACGDEFLRYNKRQKTCTNCR